MKPLTKRKEFDDLRACAKGRVLPAIIDLLERGFILSKYIVADMIHCDPKTAQRNLTHLHVENVVRVCKFMRTRGAAVPMYTVQDGRRDVKPPLALTPQQKNARRRASQDNRDKENAARNLRRSNQRQQDNPVRLGLWGL